MESDVLFIVLSKEDFDKNLLEMDSFHKSVIRRIKYKIKKRKFLGQEIVMISSRSEMGDLQDYIQDIPEEYKDRTLADILLDFCNHLQENEVDFLYKVFSE